MALDGSLSNHELHYEFTLWNNQKNIVMHGSIQLYSMIDIFSEAIIKE